ncbi:MAG: hypothetical protein AB7P08_18625 [Burkholderiales bacterium]
MRKPRADWFAQYERDLACAGALFHLSKGNQEPAVALLRDGGPLPQGFRDAIAERLQGPKPAKRGRPPHSQYEKDWKAINSALARALFDWRQREAQLPRLEAVERFGLSQGLNEGQVKHLLNPSREIAQRSRELVQIDEQGRIAGIILPREDVEPDR